MKKKIFKVSLYFLYAISLFTVIVLYNFPYGKIKSRIESGFKNKYGVTLKINNISYNFPVGLKLLGIKINNSRAKQSIALSEMDLSLSPISFLSSKTRINYYIKTEADSILNGSVLYDKKTNSIRKASLLLIKLNVDEVKQYFKNSFMFFDIGGIAKGVFDFTGNTKPLNGLLNMNIKGINFSLKIPFTHFKELKNIKINGGLELKNNIINLKNAKISQKFLDVDILGKANLNNSNISRSRINIILSVKVDPSVVDKRLMPKKILNKIMLHKKFNIRISGFLNNPSINY